MTSFHEAISIVESWYLLMGLCAYILGEVTEIKSKIFRIKGDCSPHEMRPQIYLNT